MPEGDIVYRAAGRLRTALAGKELTVCDLRVPRYATVDLRGHVVDEVGSRGKHLFVRIDRYSIHTHLKMEGVWQVYAPGQRWRRPGFTARAILGVADAVAVGFSLGKVEVLARDREDEAVGHLGPDLLGPDWDRAEALRRLTADPDRPVGLAVLDQRNLAGIGNIFRNEGCWLARVHPRRPVREVENLGELVDETQRILDASAKIRIHRPLVYGRTGMPCPRCRSARIATGPLGEGGTQQDRRIYFCPRCQE
ncbi:Fpg/Nei family DNA glycosylase [Aldersonia sp. NBC_00410]|uniref:DNA-formamidopyrimidine glycosylase family protein n=1 Tax=Aldersonia sp. NBC_00410 TaxID=2975954 RepID=UPI0022570A32|nr:DNA-formamidopyrimidine glycosylase family protein [Aldersonia sp. NBC_00410]MCX5044491.1 Fpg/Nei family DNA glycosylase [Aldersonia sp. NBC_00410]